VFVCITVDHVSHGCVVTDIGATERFEVRMEPLTFHNYSMLHCPAGSICVKLCGTLKKPVKWPSSSGVLVAQWLECLISVTEVMGSIPRWKSENLFSSSLNPLTHSKPFYLSNITVYQWKKCLWSVVERWLEEMILTLVGHFQRLFNVCTWEISGVHILTHSVHANKLTCSHLYSSVVKSITLASQRSWIRIRL